MRLHNLFIASLFFAPFHSFAKTSQAPSFYCGAELPLTSVMAEPSSSDAKAPVIFKIKHHFGAHTAPVFSGVVTMADLNHIQEKISLYQKLGDEIVIAFDKQKCENFGGSVWSCFRNDSFDLNGVPLKGVSFTTREVETKVYDYVFKSYNVVFSFILDGRSYDMPMSYSSDECHFQ
ncbi:hypothetical protein BDW_05245 [Bdellovibrio bacteriovorus W]|nr:hypothetical protein BDW_05245 [Bdellovibrio bacteriovorus W]